MHERPFIVSIIRINCLQRYTINVFHWIVGQNRTEKSPQGRRRKKSFIFLNNPKLFLYTYTTNKLDAGAYSYLKTFKKKKEKVFLSVIWGGAGKQIDALCAEVCFIF